MNYIESLKARLKDRVEAEALLRAKLLSLPSSSLDTKDTFVAFQEQEEAKAEAIVSSAINGATVKTRSFADILAAKRLIDQARQNNLAPEAEEADLPSMEVKAGDFESTEVYEEPESDSVTPVELAAEIEAEVELKENLKNESFSLSVVLNEEQLAAKEMAFMGKSFALTGAAGTGKTTAQRAIAEALLEDGRLSTSTFKTYNEEGERKYVSAPSIAFCAFTRRAASNLAKAVHKSPFLAERLQHNIMTIHSLLEFEPESYFDIEEQKDKFRFFPKRTAENPLNITHLVIEESSMLDAMTLWGYLYDALPPGVQIIFIGDINQLPPVFGPSILNYALVQLPVIELKKVYRNQGIVLENAHHILKGEPLEEDSNFVIIRGKAQVQQGQETTSRALGTLFNSWLDIIGSDGKPEYDPDDCIILSPFNVQPLGTDNLNKWIAQHLGARRKAIVHEIIAGFNKLYLAVGDRVMVNKMDGVITDIYRNPAYYGKEPQLAGSDLTRFGVRILGQQGHDSLDELGLDYANFSLEALEKEKAERKNQATHVVTVLLDNGKTEELKVTGDFGTQSFSLGYALTVHKAQGSEWRKVFIILHKDQAIMLYRELFYTAVTRARTKVTIIAKDHIIEKAIRNQRIKGDSMQDKIEYFNSGIMDSVKEPIYATK